MMNNFESCDSEKKNQLENLVILPFRYQLLLFENENFPYQTALVGIFAGKFLSTCYARFTNSNF